MTDRMITRSVAVLGAAAGLFAIALLAGPVVLAAPPADSSPTGAVTPGDPAAQPEGSAPAEDPTQLSISIDGSQPSAGPGDTLDYTVTVQNLGSADIADLLLSQSQPAGLTLASADPDATIGAGGVSWTVDLPQGASVTRHSTVTVQTTPDDLLRLATVVCALEAPDQPPLVCATHSAQLPAGAAADAAQAAMNDSAAAPTDPDRTWWYLAGGTAAAMAVVLGAWLLSRRRTLRRLHAEEEQPARDATGPLTGTRSR